MGVDANSYVIYGIEWNGPTLVERWDDDTSLPFIYHVENEDSDYSDDYILEYNVKWIDRNNIRIITEPYGSNWTVIGIDFLDSDIETTISNLSKVKEEWNKLIDAIRNSGYTDKIEEPSIMSEAYFS